MHLIGNFGPNLVVEHSTWNTVDPNFDPWWHLESKSVKELCRDPVVSTNNAELDESGAAYTM